MHDDDDRPLDLAPLAPDADARARRVVNTLAARIASERAGERAEERAGVLHDIGRRLARYAIPAALAAAASVVALVSARPRAGTPDPFATAVMGRGPATRWVMQGRAPEPGELVAIAGREP